MSSRTHTPLKLVHDAETDRSDANSTLAGTDLHTGDPDQEGAADLRDVSYCAFCASPMPEPGFPCCADYAATVDPSFQLRAPQAESVPTRPVIAPETVPVRPPASAPTSLARYFSGSYILLLGLLVTCVGVLAVALAIQMRNAAAASRELAETRRLHEEMVALMKEARREAAGPPVAPPAPAVQAVEIPTAEAGAPPQVVAGVPPQVAPAVAPPQTAPVVASPRVAPAASSTVANAETASNSVAPTSLAFFGTGTSLARVPYSANAAPAPAATADLATSRLSVARPAAEPPKKARERIEPRRPAVVAQAREKSVELDREPASPPAKIDSSPADSATSFEELASLPPAVRVPAMPPRPAIIPRGWLKLERGMSPTEVRRLLGSPPARERLMSGEFWYYGERSIFGRAWVAFSDGAVIEWLTP